MSILEYFTKQPSEVLDYDVDFTKWFSNRADVPVAFVVVSDPGVTISSARTGNVVKVTVSGGVHNGRYKITVRLTTSTSIVKEADFIVSVKES